MRALSSRPGKRQRVQDKVRRRLAQAAVLEPMEHRRLLSGTVVGNLGNDVLPGTVVGTLMLAPSTATLADGSAVDWRADGTVHVTGTSGDDNITLSQRNFSLGAGAGLYQVTINGQIVTLSTPTSSPLVRFDVDAGDGNDSVTVTGPFGRYSNSIEDVQPPVSLGNDVVVFPYRPDFGLPVSLSGGAGDDTLSGGTGDDTLDGGAGVDQLTDFYGHNQFITDAGPVQSGDAGRWYEIAGGGFLGITTDGTLDVRGTDSADVIAVGWDLTHPTRADQPLTATVNGISSASIMPPGATVARVHVDAAGGDDQVTVDANVRYPATVLGGAGDDTLNGDATVDELDLNTDVTGNPGRPVDHALGGTAFVLQLPNGGTISWDPAGILSVQGTSGDDNIAFGWLSGANWGDQPQLAVTVNNDTWTFRPDDGTAVTRIDVDAGDGNDRIQANQGIQVVPLYLWYDSGITTWSNPGGATSHSFTIPILAHGGAGNDTIWGGEGADTLYGGDGDDQIDGGHGDQIYGDAGADSLFAGGGSNSLYGGAGDDRLFEFDPDGLIVPGDVGDAPLPYGTGDWYEVGGAVAGVMPDGTLYVRGTAGDDVITVDMPGGAFFEGPPIEVTANGVTRSIESWLMGQNVDRILVEAGDGNDRVTVGARLTTPAVVDGGAGDDVLTIDHPTYAPTTLIGGDGADTLDGDAGTDYLVVPVDPEPTPPILVWPQPPVVVTWPSDPSPVVSTPPVQSDPLTPSPNPPVQQANPASPVVLSLAVDAPTGPVVTKAGTRVALAGGASIQWRANGVFVVRGTPADDVIRVGRSGKGKDATLLVKVNNVTRAFRVGTAPIRRVDIDAGDGDDAVLLGGSDVDGSVFSTALDVAATITGGRGNDTLVGGSKADTIHGNAGQDSIDGGAGNDLLYGDAGTDTLAGGAGRDRAVGAKGHDAISDVEAAT